MPFPSPRLSPQSSPTLPPAGTGPLTSDFRTWPGLDDLSLSASPLHVQLLVETTALAGDVQPHDVLECLLHPMVPDDTLGGVIDRLFGVCRVEWNGLCREDLSSLGPLMNAYMDAQTEDRIAHPVAALLADSKLPGHGRLTAQVIRSLGVTWPLHGGGFGDDLPVILRTLIREGRTAGEERRMVIRVIRQARAPLLTVSPEERLKQVRPLILGQHLLSARSFSCQVDALWELLRPEEADDPAWTGRPSQRRNVFLGVLHEVLPREDDEDDEDNWLACGQYGPLPARYGAPESMSATRQRWVQAAADSLWALAGQVGVQDDAWVQGQLLTVFHHAWLPALAALRPPEGSSFRQVLEWSSARRDATVWIWSDCWLGPLRWPQWDELRHRAHAESWREAEVLQDTDHDGRRHSFHRQQNARERRPVEMKRALLRWPSPGLCMEMVNGERYAGIDFSWLKDDPELQAALPGLLEMSPDLSELLS